MTWLPDCGLVETIEQAERLIEALREDLSLVVSVDIETGYDGEARESAAKHPEEAFIAGISLTNSLRWGRYIPLRHDVGPNLDNAAIAVLLWPLFRDGKIIAHGGKFELRFLSRWFAKYLADHPAYGLEVAAAHLGAPEFCGYFELYSDTMLEMYAEGKLQSIGLKYATKQTFGVDQMELHELFALQAGKPLTKKQEKSIRFNELDLLGEHRQAIVEYACGDVIYALGHHQKRHPALSDPAHPQHFIYQLEMAVLPICCAMEDEGVLVDWPLMRENSVKAELFAGRLAEEINQDFTKLLLAKGIDEPCNVNLGSTPQLGRVLYEQLGFPVPHYTSGGKSGERKPSVDKDALKALARQDPVIPKIRNHSSLRKLNGTYLSVYPDRFSYAPDGRSHPNMLQHGVPAGRFSVSDWPYQQSPRYYFYELADGSTFECHFRNHVMAPEGWYGIGFDYAQQEVRVIAGEAQEQVLMEAFRNGDDLHSVTASRILSVPLEEVTKEQRALGKTIGLALGYQLGVDGLADRLQVPVERAQELYDAYFSGYPALQPYTARIVAQARRDGFLVTRFGRRVPVWGYQSVSRGAQAEADRTAGNIPIQGPGTGDYPKIAMVRADRALKAAGIRDKVRMVMNMHDALEFYVHKSLAPETVIRVLQPAVVFTLPQIAHWPPIVAEWHIWERWGSPVELVTELDSSGNVVSVKPVPPKAANPVQQSGDEEVPVEPAVVAAVPAAVPGDGQGEGTGLSGSAGGRSPGRTVAGHHAGDSRRLVIDVPGLSMDRAHALMNLVNIRPGPHSLVIRMTDGTIEPPEVTTGLTPKDEAEIKLVIGDCLVSWEPGSFDAASLVR